MTDLLADPVNALSVTVTAPNDSNLYGSFAGKPVQFVVIACYPVSATGVCNLLLLLGPMMILFARSLLRSRVTPPGS